MVLPQEIAPEKVRPLRRAEYDRLVEWGLFAGERVELLRGALIEMTPQGTRHAEVVRRLTRMLTLALSDKAIVQVQLPFAASEDSEPEPDLAVLPIADYSRAHPTTAALVIEVADSSLQKDRALKTGVYAQAGVPEYWLINLVEDTVEVFSAPSEAGYAQVLTRRRGESLSPSAFPDLRLAISDLLP